MMYHLVLILIGCLFISAPSLAQNSAEYEFMDRLAVEANTDKSSRFHRYTEVYSELFSSLKNKPIKFLEIGIFKGNSVKLWEKYFPIADLHFIDIQKNHVQYWSRRSHYHFFDQGDDNAMEAFAKGSGTEFDIIIDDGGHFMDQQISSFIALFPRLKSGGLYVIEDMHTSYWSSYGGNGTLDQPKAGSGTALEFFKDLIEDLNYTAARTECADWKKTPSSMRECLNEYQSDIFSIQFFKSLCVIKKR